jgi:hypothetical protein
LSNATPGSARGFEPVATITCFAVTPRLRAIDANLPSRSGAAAGERSQTVEERDLVLLEEIEDPVVVLRDDLFLARLHALHVEREPLTSMPCSANAWPRFRSSRTTAAAPSTECSRRSCTCRRAPASRRARPVVDAGGLEAELRAADRGDVAAGPAPITTTSN